MEEEQSTHSPPGGAQGIQGKERGDEEVTGRYWELKMWGDGFFRFKDEAS